MARQLFFAESVKKGRPKLLIVGLSRRADRAVVRLSAKIGSQIQVLAVMRGTWAIAKAVVERFKDQLYPGPPIQGWVFYDDEPLREFLRECELDPFALDRLLRKTPRVGTQFPSPLPEPETLEEDWRLLRPTVGGRGNVVDLVGWKFGLLKVTARAGSDKHGSSLWTCRCACGKQKVCRRSDLRRGKVTSCGCGAEIYRASAKPWLRREPSIVRRRRRLEEEIRQIDEVLLDPNTWLDMTSALTLNGLRLNLVEEVDRLDLETGRMP